MYRVERAIAAVAVFLACAQTSLAVKITNLTTGEVLFFDNLELDTVGTTPDMAHLGTWSSVAGFDEVITGGFGASEGVNYLSTKRTAQGVGGAQANIPVQSTAGHQIRVEFMMRLPSGIDAAPYLVGDNQPYRCLMRVTGTRVQYYDGTAYVTATGPGAYAVNTWQRWQFDYTVGATSATLSIAGGAAITLGTLQDLGTPGGGGVAGFAFAHNGLNTYWVDAVAATAPPNNACASATAIGAGTVIGTTLGATNDGSASCGNSASSPDVWYAFTATCTGDLNINTCGTAFNSVVSVHSGCPGTSGNQLACNDDCAGTPCGPAASCVTAPVTSGNTYHVRVAGANGAQGYFTMNLSCNASPPNDACVNAQPITAGAPLQGTTLAATNDGSSSCDAASADVWYSYNATFTGNLSVDLCGSGNDTAVSVHSAGCPGTVGTELACNDDCAGAPCGGTASCLLVPVVSGNDYLIRVVGAKGAKANFTLTLNEPPAHDNCAAAQSIGNGTFIGTTVAATNDGSSSCGNSATSADVWYSYTATCTGDLLAETCGSGFDTVVSLHSACPGSPGNEIMCSNDCGGSPCGGTSSCMRAFVTSGSVYKIRVAGANGNRGSFTMNVSCTPAPPNDACASAIAVAPGTYMGTTLGSSDDGGSTCGAPGSGDVWYQYTAASSGELLVSTCGSNYNTLVSVHSACPGTAGNELASGCNDDCPGSPCGGNASCVAVPISGGSTYFIRVSGAAGQKGNFSLQIRHKVPNPAGAMIVENVTTATLLFSDDFENAFLGQIPTTSGFGNWTAVPGLDLVTDAASPGAFEGGNFLSTTRTGSTVGNPIANFTPQSTFGQLVHAEFMMYLPAGTDMGLLLVGDNTAYRTIIRPGGLGQGTVADYNGAAYNVIPGLTYTPDKWEKWELDYVLGDLTVSVRIDNGPPFPATALHDLIPGGGGVRAVSFSHNATATFYVDAVKPPENDVCAAAIPITEGIFRGLTKGTTNDGSATCGNSAASPDVWYAYTASCTGDMHVNTCGSDYDTVVSLHSNTCPGTSGTQLGTACNDNCGGNPCAGPSSCLTAPVTAGNTYLIRVSGVNGATGRFQLNVFCGPPPSNDNCGTPIAIGTGTYQGTTLQTTNDGEASCGSSSSGPDVYYSINSTCADTLKVTASGAFYTPVVSAHTLSCPTLLSTQFDCSADQTPIFVDTAVGQDVLIRVGGVGGTSGNFTLNVACVSEICNNSVDDDGDDDVDCEDADCVANPVCSGCSDPFADADADTDVDLDDFAAFQNCYTGAGGGVPANCGCFDSDNNGVGDGDVDMDDFQRFRLCATRSEVAANPACDG